MKRTGKERGEHSRAMGKAGEYAVAAQLILRDVHPLWPSIDTGFDLQTLNGCRIQVKSSHIDGTNRKGENYYWFPLGPTKYVPLSDAKSKVVTRKKLSEVCDIVVFWGIEQNRFWIVPASVCDGQQALVLGYNNERRFAGSIDKMREMAALGYTHQEIADMNNMLRSNVTKYINSQLKEIKPSGMSLARACENAWEHILDFGSPAADEARVDGETMSSTISAVEVEK